MPRAATLPTRPTLDTILDVVRAEFREMPGMRLSRAQMRRLWQLDDRQCDALTRHLLAEGFLREDDRGHLHRAGEV
jgi:hypothetical protein